MKSRLLIAVLLIIVLLAAAAYAAFTYLPWPVTPAQRAFYENNKDVSKHVNPKTNNDSDVFFEEGRWTTGIFVREYVGTKFLTVPAETDDQQFQVFSPGDGVLRLQNNFDRDFIMDKDNERYNNVAMVGLVGWRPTEKTPTVQWSFNMRISDTLYGSTGFVIQPVDTFTFNENGEMNKDPKMSLFGFSFNGVNNVPAGLNCHTVYDWIPTHSTNIKDIDETQWHAYAIRFTRQSPGIVLAEGLIDGDVVCSDTLFDFGPTEAQIWVDNYNFRIWDDKGDYGITYGNQYDPQWVEYSEIAVRAGQLPK